MAERSDLSSSVEVGGSVGNLATSNISQACKRWDGTYSVREIYIPSSLNPASQDLYEFVVLAIDRSDWQMLRHCTTEYACRWYDINMVQGLETDCMVWQLGSPVTDYSSQRGSTTS